MSLTALLDRITNRQKERDQRRRTGFHELVRRIAEGNEPDIELHEVAKQISAAHERRTELDNEIRTLREWSESDLHESTVVPMHAEDLRERSKQRAARAERLAGELADVEKVYAELDARIRPLRERLLEP